MFGAGSLDRSFVKKQVICWLVQKQKSRNCFEFFQKLGVPYYSFHDVDIAPESIISKNIYITLATIVDILEKVIRTVVKLLWGTANCFTNPRYMSGLLPTLIRKYLLGQQHKFLPQ